MAASNKIRENKTKMAKDLIKLIIISNQRTQAGGSRPRNWSYKDRGSTSQSKSSIPREKSNLGQIEVARR